MRTILVLAGLVAVTAAPATAGAQHGATPALAAHAAAAPKPAAKPPEKPAVAAKKTTPKTNLEAAFDRIAQKIEGAEVTPGGLRVSASGGQGRAAEAHPADPHGARPEATPRIHLNWRASVVWPALPGPVETDDSASPHETARITLVWQ